LQQWLTNRPFKLVGYLPIDASGPNDRLTFPLMQTLLGFDRLLAYGEFGEGVIRRTIGDDESNKRHLVNIPHGINGQKFFELPRSYARNFFFRRTGAQPAIPSIGPDGMLADPKPLDGDEVLIGIVATNQERKNWAIGLRAVSLLERKMKVRLWLHCDKLERHWSIPALLIDYGIVHRTVLTVNRLPDEVMAEAYSACDLTFGIGAEGWGFPSGESLACSTPVITGSYGGAADFVPKEMQVVPRELEIRGIYSSERPIYRAEDWAARAEEWIGKRTNLNPRYEWNQLWRNEWEPYLGEAAK
jgi:glycosyltransferase involved in cell wall biosynthesis